MNKPVNFSPKWMGVCPMCGATKGSRISVYHHHKVRCHRCGAVYHIDRTIHPNRLEDEGLGLRWVLINKGIGGTYPELKGSSISDEVLVLCEGNIIEVGWWDKKFYTWHFKTGDPLSVRIPIAWLKGNLPDFPKVKP